MNSIQLTGGESLLIRQAQFPHLMWKLSPGKLPFPLTWNNVKMDIFNIHTFPLSGQTCESFLPKHELF